MEEVSRQNFYRATIEDPEERFKCLKYALINLLLFVVSSIGKVIVRRIGRKDCHKW
jgi:hypothetical protein